MGQVIYIDSYLMRKEREKRVRESASRARRTHCYTIQTYKNGLYIKAPGYQVKQEKDDEQKET